MPMQIFVRCVDDLATLGRVRVGLDLGLFFPWFFTLIFFSPQRFGEWKVFTLAVPLCSGRMEFLRCGDGSKAHVGSPCCLDNIRLERKCIARLFGLSLVLV